MNIQDDRKVAHTINCKQKRMFTFIVTNVVTIIHALRKRSFVSYSIGGYSKFQRAGILAPEGKYSKFQRAGILP